MANVAFIGTGLLGSAMVEGMLKRGDSVTVWNRTESKARALEASGAKVAGSPADAVDGADRVHMTLPDDAVVNQIGEGLASRLRPSATVIDHSTTSPRGTKSRIARARKGGIKFIHAPVFMSPQMARDSVGLMLVSGPLAVFEEVHAALARRTGEVWYAGQRGGRGGGGASVGGSVQGSCVEGSGGAGGSGGSGRSGGSRRFVHVDRVAWRRPCDGTAERERDCKLCEGASAADRSDARAHH